MNTSIHSTKLDDVKASEIDGRVTGRAHFYENGRSGTLDMYFESADDAQAAANGLASLAKQMRKRGWFVSDCKWTPGPWAVEKEDFDSVVSRGEIDDGGDIICDAPEYAEDSMQRWIHNAHLIAEAPELWSELYETHSALMFKDPDYLGSERYKRNALVLAKARGEES